MTDSDLFSTQMNLPYSAVNVKGWAKAEWLLNAFQDIAGHHSHLLGISGFDMAPKKLKWVVAQYRIQMHSPMHWLAPFTLSTWRFPWKNLYDVRRFSVTSPSGERLADATGIWILIKAENGRPQRLSPHMPEHLMTVGGGEDPGLIKSHPPMDDGACETQFKILFQDLDLNRHVNNGVYLKWALESMPHDLRFTYRPKVCAISFLKECFYPGTVTCRVRIRKTLADMETCHAIVRPEDGETLARVTLQWEAVHDR